MLVRERRRLLPREHEVPARHPVAHPLRHPVRQRVVVDQRGPVAPHVGVPHPFAERVVAEVRRVIHVALPVSGRAVARHPPEADLHVQHLLAEQLLEVVVNKGAPRAIRVRVTGLDAVVDVVLPVRLVRVRRILTRVQVRVHGDRVHAIRVVEPRPVCSQCQKPLVAVTFDVDADVALFVRSIAQRPRGVPHDRSRNRQLCDPRRVLEMHIAVFVLTQVQSVAVDTPLPRRPRRASRLLREFEDFLDPSGAHLVHQVSVFEHIGVLEPVLLLRPRRRVPVQQR